MGQFMYRPTEKDERPKRPRKNAVMEINEALVDYSLHQTCQGLETLNPGSFHFQSVLIVTVNKTDFFFRSFQCIFEAVKTCKL